MKTLKKEKGITLIALAVTIIVMLILAGVTIATLTSENGIINQSSKVKETNKVAKTEEEAKLEYSNLILEKQMEGHGEETELSDVIEKLEENGYETAGKDGKNYIKIGEYYYEIKLENAQVSIAKDRTEGITGVGTGTVASNSQSYVGYYADVNKDGKVDGIIYADLVAGKKGTGTWSETGNSTYDFGTITTGKKYYVSETDYTNVLGGTNKIITGKGSGEDRFYVMSLSDLNVAGNTYYWYYSAYEQMSDYATYTSTAFGKGKENTEKMIEKWNNGTSGTTPYGAPNDKDLWKYIQNDVTGTGKRWFIPSKAEWSAFGGELGITKGNYSTKGLRGWYWTSSQCKNITSWMASFIAGYMTDFLVNQDGISVRLSTTF